MIPQEWEPIAARIRAAWPDFAIDEATARAYVTTLADLDARAVALAVDDLLREPREHAPPPGVTRGRVLGPRAAATSLRAAVFAGRRGTMRAAALVEALKDVPEVQRVVAVYGVAAVDQEPLEVPPRRPGPERPPRRWRTR